MVEADNEHEYHPEQYADDVISGKIIVGKLQRRFVERHRHDLIHGPKRGLVFDEDAGWRVIDFFQFLHHSKGKWAGQTFELSGWQKFLLWVLFGWKQAATGLRRFKLAYNEIARKNGKSTLAAGIGLYLLVADGEHGAEIYSAATKKDQARIVHSEAVRMVRSSPLLRKKLSVYANNINIPKTASKFEPLSADQNTLDGLNVHGAIIDELHAHKTREVFDLLDTATGSREQPLIFVITTAGFNKTGVAMELRDYGRRVLDGFDVEGATKDDTFFVFIACLDDDDDWRDESVWIKANPNLNISVNIDDLRTKCKKAVENPAAQNSFRCKHMNEWTNQEVRFIPMHSWDRCIGDTVFSGECYGGLDLANTTDLVAWVLVFPKEDNIYHVLPRFWIPKENAREKGATDRVNYEAWGLQNFINLAPGETVDYSWILKQIDDDARKYNIREVGFDRWGAEYIVSQLDERGMKVVPCAQTVGGLSSPTKELLNLILQGKLIHGGHPILRWNADNVVVETDPAGNIRPSKKKSVHKIDGIIALVMALDRAIRNKNKSSVYEERDIVVI